jgi:hypothetical protein
MPHYIAGTNPFRLRISVKNDGHELSSRNWQLYVSKNGGPYQAITTTSTHGVKAVDAGSSVDEAPILVPRLTMP